MEIQLIYAISIITLLGSLLAMGLSIYLEVDIPLVFFGILTFVNGLIFLPIISIIGLIVENSPIYIIGLINFALLLCTLLRTLMK